MRLLLLSLALLAPLSVLAQTEDTEEKLDPGRIDLAGLIECRRELADFHYLAPALMDPLQAVSLGWRPLPQANLFMTEYALIAPVTVFGHKTDHIAFAGNSIIAVLNLPDPRPLAKQLELEAAIDTPEKAMFGKELVSLEETDEKSGTTFVRSVVLNVSNVSSHPGKTLVGCSYSLDLAEDPAEESPEAPAESTPASAVDAAPR